MQKLIKKTEKGEEVLKIEAKHHDGEYFISVNKHTIEGDWTTWQPMDDGNFRFTVMRGRKSQKKLDKLNEIIDSMEYSLYDHWINKRYMNIVERINCRLAQEGII